MKVTDEIQPQSDQGLTVMISSSVYGYEDQLKQIEAFFISLGYRVVMSMSGTLRVDPRLGNFANCLNAVEQCDIFFGIIRPNCGTGRSNDKSITYQEFIHARECHKPAWYVIDSKVQHYKDLLRTLLLRECPNVKDEDFMLAIRTFYDKQIRERKRLPKVLDLYEPNREARLFDPECFEMERFVNQLDVPREEVINNWMQYCDDLASVLRFIAVNFEDRLIVESIIKES